MNSRARDLSPERYEFGDRWTLPNGQLTDEYLSELYTRLLRRVGQFASKHFQNDGAEPPLSSSPWAFQSSIEGDNTFERYVQQVCRPDLVFQEPWDEVIRFEESRILLVVGVFMKILHDQVFSRLLFGADTEQLKLLSDQDRAYIGDDGFARSRLRSENIKFFLDRTGGKPVQFWPQVDNLTHMIVVQFLPLFRWIGNNQTDDPLGCSELYQDVHEQVALAAWLSIQMRRSSSIVHVEWPVPGSRWDPTLDNVSGPVFARSRSAAREYDKQPTPSEPRGGGRVARAARIMIVVAPELKRYTLQRNGQRVYSLLRAKVACYFGLADDIQDEKRHTPDLLRYSLFMKQKAKWSKGWMFAWWVAFWLLALTFCRMICFACVSLEISKHQITEPFTSGRAKATLLKELFIEARDSVRRR